MLKDLRIYNIRTMSDIKITNYKRSKIYMIYCEDDGVDEFYIGSSTDLLNRVRVHKHDCNNPDRENYNNKLYTYIRENFGFDNFTVKTLERYSCENDLQLRQREQKWIDELKPTLNQKKAYISLIEQQQKNRDKSTEFRKENREVINQKMKENIKCDNCDKITDYGHYARHKKTKYCINYKSNV